MRSTVSYHPKNCNSFNHKEHKEGASQIFPTSGESDRSADRNARAPEKSEMRTHKEHIERNLLRNSVRNRCAAG